MTEPEIVGAPDLVIEILSPGTQERDRGLKRTVYARAGVREYWLVDTGRKSIEALDLGERRTDASTRFGLGDALRSIVLPDLCLPLDDAFESVT